MVVLGVPKGPGGVAVVVRPAQEPTAAGAGGTTGPWGAGGVRLLPENLYGGIHRGTGPTGRREIGRIVQTAGGECPGKREKRERNRSAITAMGL